MTNAINPGALLALYSLLMEQLVAAQQRIAELEAQVKSQEDLE